jgi:K(+)-stimulated pyrophosphate-energized sodium pump
MAGASRESAREITDKLDAVGNTTKALTKGYAVASAGLAAFLLFSAYLDKVKERLEIPLTAELPIDLSKVDVFVGGLLGAMLVFLFSSLAIRAVGNAAGAIIEEVRRQFRSDPGIMAAERPDYARVITRLVTLRRDHPEYRSARRSSSASEAGGWRDADGQDDGGVICDRPDNSSGVGDGKSTSSPRLEGRGKVIGKGTPEHAAAVVGDTVGEPFRTPPARAASYQASRDDALVLAPLFI